MATKGWAHRDVCAGPCVSQAAALAQPMGQDVCGERTPPFSKPRCACPGGRLFSAVAICLHAEFCNKDYFQIGQGCERCVSYCLGDFRSRKISQS